MISKQQVLSEIGRTAKENAGVPLGRERFFAATGIKESDWQGKYWARWSDAVEEAGFTPNRLTQAYSDEFLLESYAALALELGRLPVTSELKLRSRSLSTFPSHNTFARFGEKQQLLARLRAFAGAHESFALVAQWCESASSGPPESESPLDSQTETSGFVYLIKAGRHYKIGKTNSLGRRERELAIQLPEQAKTIHAIRTDDPSGIEGYWHLRFADKRKNGEWFELSQSDVVAFRRRKFM